MLSPCALSTEATLKVRGLILIIRRSFQDILKLAFIPLHGALVRPPACSPIRMTGINQWNPVE